MRAIAFLAFLACIAGGQEYVLESNVLDGGGFRVASANYACGFSVGQTAASGQLSSTDYRAVLGFWNRGFDLIGIREGGLRLSLEPKFRFMPCSPNPFQSRTVLHYVLPEPAAVSLDVFDHSGRLVGSLVQAGQQSGRYRVIWDVSGVSRQELPNGVYFLRLVAGEFRSVRKAVVAR